jgi:sugar O-acyltransferase (sialic acid O-acetyltransferase NeuD family)
MRGVLVKNGVFILGAGGCGRVALDIYSDLGREEVVLGFLEENCSRDGEILNGKPIHDVSYLGKLAEDNQPLLIAAIGSAKRKHLVEDLERKGYRFDSIIHPNVVCSRWATIGEGSIVAPGVVIDSQVVIGRHVVVNHGAHVCHDAKVGDYVTISPGAGIMGRVKIGDEVLVGVNATVVEGVTVGNGAIIAAGAVVLEDVPEMSLVAGIPAKVKRKYRSHEERPW